MIIANQILNAYLECALWSTLTRSGANMGDIYNLSDISNETIEQCELDLEEFFELAGDLLTDLDLHQVAQDFWLTRNRHGAGFWDGDYDEYVGKQLTELAHTFGSIDLYEGYDELLYVA